MVEIDITAFEEMCKVAASEILQVYHSDFEVNMKEDASPLTKADEASNQVICRFLTEVYPDIPIISEEHKNMEYAVRRHWKSCWLIDPLDGTKEFVKKNGEFTINIALIEKGIPVFGLIYIPISGAYYYAKKHKGAFKVSNAQEFPLSGGMRIAEDLDELFHNHWNGAALSIIGSRSHMNAETEKFVESLQKNHAITSFITAGSALKFCLLAEGKADIYPRFAPTMEWDTAAGQIIIEEAGKKLYDLNTKEEMRYNRESLVNDWFVGF